MKCQHSYNSQSWRSVIKDTISEQQPMNTDIMAREWISGWHPDDCEPASTWKQCGVHAKRLVQSVWKPNQGVDWKVASVQPEMIPQLHKKWFHENLLWCDSAANTLPQKPEANHVKSILEVCLNGNTGKEYWCVDSQRPYPKFTVFVGSDRPHFNSDCQIFSCLKKTIS